MIASVPALPNPSLDRAVLDAWSAFHALEQNLHLRWLTPEQLVPLRAALAAGGSPNQRSRAGGFLLNLAVLSACRDSNAREDSQVPPLVALLLEFHADPNRAMAKDMSGTPLRDAAEFVGLPLLDALLAAGANPAGVVEVEEPETVVTFGPQGLTYTAAQDLMRTALHHAKSTAHVRRLVAAGADLNAQDTRGTTPLSLAVQYGKDEVIDALLDLGARTNLVDQDGNTPLHLALRGHQVQRLLDAGADPSLRNRNGQTLLDVVRPVLLEEADRTPDPMTTSNVQRLTEMAVILERFVLDQVVRGATVEADPSVPVSRRSRL